MIEPCFFQLRHLNIYGVKSFLQLHFLLIGCQQEFCIFKNPWMFSKNCFPTSRLVTNISLKNFRCTAFVHIHSHNRGKLDPKVRKCVFVDYSPRKKDISVLTLFQENCLCLWMWLSFRQPHLLIIIIYRGGVRMKILFFFYQ